MIRRGDTFRIGPLRIPVLGNNNGQCSVVAIYGETATIGMVSTVDEEALEQLAQEEGVLYTQERPSRRKQD